MKVIGIDGGGVLHSAIFSHMAQPKMPATYTYLSMLFGYMSKLEATLDDIVIIAQDYGRSWRKNVDPEYKAQRRAFREERKPKEWWTEQYQEFEKLFLRLDSCLPYYFIKSAGVEADDILSIMCRYYKDKEVIIVSKDRDLEQLAVFQNVKIFSPMSKKFKNICNPIKILLEKIQGDISDNLITKPTTEAEFEKRKTIVDLTQLPDFVEAPIKLQLDALMPKSLNIPKIPFGSIQERVRKIYKI